MKNFSKLKAMRSIAGNLNRARSAKVPLLITIIGVVIVFGLAGCATTEYADETPADKIPVPGASLLIVQRAKTPIGSAVRMKVWMDGEEVAGSIKNGVRTFVAIPNGSHTIQAGSTKLDHGNEITFVVNDEEIIFLAEPSMGLVAARFVLQETGKRKLR